MQKKSVFHPVSGRSIVSMERANREGMGIFLSESRSVFLGRGEQGWMDGQKQLGWRSAGHSNSLMTQSLSNITLWVQYSEVFYCSQYVQVVFSIFFLVNKPDHHI